MVARPVHILNGPNLNLLGSREPEIYGTSTLADIERMCAARLGEYDLEIKFDQSNDEGALVGLVQAARSTAGGLILNAGAYTHTSIALHDALQALEIPAIEVHLSNIFAREPFRHHSYISPTVQGVICGLGPKGYLLAVDAIATLIKE